MLRPLPPRKVAKTHKYCHPRCGSARPCGFPRKICTRHSHINHNSPVALTERRSVGASERRSVGASERLLHAGRFFTGVEPEIFGGKWEGVRRGSVGSGAGRRARPVTARRISGRVGVPPAVLRVPRGTRRTSHGARTSRGVRMYSAGRGIRRAGRPPYPRHAVRLIARLGATPPRT